MNRQNTPPLPAAFQAIADMPEQARFPWLATAMLACESLQVIQLRLAKIAIGGDAADQEACLMVSEKVEAMFEAGENLMAGATPASVVDRYREHVAANARRLSAI